MKQILMCRPDHFQVKYVINPWMSVGSVDTHQAIREWETLVATYKDLGVHVDVISQDSQQPDMVFATDEGIVVGRRFIASNFSHPERAEEVTHYISWFRDKGFEIQRLPLGSFEGGDFCRYQNLSFLGIGFRSDIFAAHALRQILDRTIIPLELVDPKFYHLDTCLFALGSDALMVYPSAFSSKSLQVLQQFSTNIIHFSQDQVEQFAANSVIVGRTVLTTCIDKSFLRTLTRYGYDVRILDLSEFMKAGGGIHCLTLPIQQEEAIERKEIYARSTIYKS